MTQVESQIRELSNGLASYAPTRVDGVRGAHGFDELEAYVAVPPELRALWSWADGFDGLLVMFADSPERAVDLYSVRDALQTIELNRDVSDFPEDLLPFAGEPGSGDCYVVDGEGRVRYWDHEEEEAMPHADALAVVLANTLRALREQTLFGGPER